MAKRSEKEQEIGGEMTSTAGGRAQASLFTRNWFPGLILILAVMGAYQPMWRAGYIWDDDFIVTANPCIVGPLGLKEIWTTNAADICPLTLTTFWLEHALWGFAPLGFHLVNVFLHGACAVLLWRVLRGLQAPGAWLGAALWALHPLQVESVAWISETKNTESGLFFLLSILCFVRWLRARNLNQQNGGGWNYALTLLFAALAMASKSSTVILPVVLCLCAWWVEGRWQWRNLVKVAPIFLMSIVAGVVSMWTLSVNGPSDPQWARSWPERLATAGDAVWFYLGKLIWPHPLITVYPRWEIDASQWTSYLPLLAVMIVLFILWLKRETWSRPWFFVFAYFLVVLFPGLGLIDNFIFRYSFVFDHFQYLAGMGPLALAGAGMVRLADFVIPGRYRLQSSLGAGVLLILGIWSWQRSCVYESEETLWTDTLMKNPNCWVGYNNLGNAFLHKGETDKAMAEFQKSLAINPNFAQAHSNLGNALAQKGQEDEAMAEYQKALEIKSNYAEVHANLGDALLKKGRVDEAMAEFQKALAIKPNLAEVHNNLGLAFSQKGQVDEAMTEYQNTLKINPNYANAHYNLGNALAQKGQVDEAMAEFQKALEINPGLADAHNNLGNALAQKGQMDEAMAEYEKTVEINPGDAEAHNNLGNALLQRGRVDEAIAHLQKALEINPDMANTHNSFGVALFQKGKLAEAMAQFQEALRLDPRDLSAQNNLAKVRAMAAQKASSK